MLISGYCPKQKCTSTISVSYLDASTTTEKQYIKGNFCCEYSSGNKCNGNTCPIYKSAPKYK